MEGIGILVAALFILAFGPPIVMLATSAALWKKNRKLAVIFLIIGLLWLVIGGGSCLTLLLG